MGGKGTVTPIPTSKSNESSFQGHNLCLLKWFRAFLGSLLFVSTQNPNENAKDFWLPDPRVWGPDQAQERPRPAKEHPAVLTSVFWQGSAGFGAQGDRLEFGAIIEGDGPEQVGGIVEGTLEIFGDGIVGEDQVLLGRRRRRRGGRDGGRGTRLLLQQVGLVQRRRLRGGGHR